MADEAVICVITLFNNLHHFKSVLSVCDQSRKNNKFKIKRKLT